MKEEAKNQAIQDIKQDLVKEGHCFIMFIERLNPVMDELVNNQLAM